MAKLTQDEIKWTLTIDAKGVNKELAVTSSEIHKLTDANRTMNTEMKAAERQMKQQEKEMQRLARAGKQDSEAYQEASASMQSARAEMDSYIKKIGDNEKAIKDKEKSLTELTKSMDLNEMSMKQLKDKASELRMQLNVTSKAADPEAYKALDKELKGVYGRMNELRTSSNSLIDQFAAMDNPVGMATRAVQGLGTAFKALIANPIGVVIMVIVGAFMALKAAINSSEDASVKFQQVMAPFRVLMDTILNIVQGLVKTFLDLTVAFMGWVTKAAENLPWIGNWFEKFNKKAQEGVDIEQRKLDLKNRERDALVENAKKENEIAELRNKARQRELYSNEEIIGFLDKAMELEEEITDEKIEQAKIKLDILKLENRHADNVAETNDEIAKQTALIVELDTQRQNSSRRMISERSARNRELSREDETALKASLDKQISDIDLALKEESLLLKEQLANNLISQDEYNNQVEQKLSESLHRKLAIAGIERDKRIEIEEQILDLKIELQKQEEQIEKDREALIKKYLDKNKEVHDLEIEQVIEKHEREHQELEIALERGLITKLEFMELEAKAIEEKEEELKKKKKEKEEQDAEKELKALMLKKELEKMALQQAYNAGLISKEEYEQALLALDAHYNKQSVNIAGLSYDAKLQLQKDSLNAATKLMEEENAEIAKKQKEKLELFTKFSVKIGETLGHAISGNERMMQSSLKAISMMMLDQLEKHVLMMVAKATATSLAQADSVATFGTAGLARAGIMAGLIKGAFAGVKAVVNNSFSSSSKSKSSNTPSKNDSPAGGRREYIGLESGGYMDVSRAQDGKKYKALVNPNLRGYINKPTVLVGDGPAGKSREWVASNDALQNPTIAPIIELLNQAQVSGNIRTIDMNHLMRANMAGFQNGGYTAPSSSSSTTIINNEVDANNAINKEMLELLRDLKHNGIPASVSLSDLQRKTDILETSRNIGSK